MPLSSEKVQEIVRLRKSGCSKKQIKDTTGCAIPTIEKYLLENGFTKESLSDNWKMSVIKRLVNFSVKASEYKKFLFIQIKGFEKLYKQFPSQEFWQKVSFAEGKFSSINYLSYEPMFSALKDKFNLFKYKVPEKKSYQQEEEKAGEDVTITRRAKTIKEFLK
tara:strand:- start:23 stop:511 length:489 start_codon:yes stop_codon:yes gene_type:complete